MLNIRFRDRTNTWPGFVDLFSNLVIICLLYKSDAADE